MRRPRGLDITQDPDGLYAQYRIGVAEHLEQLAGILGAYACALATGKDEP